MNDFNWDYFNETITKTNETYKCCDDYNGCSINGYTSCINCGMVNLNSPIFCFDINSPNYTAKHKYPYKRFIYFKQKLNYINSITYYAPNPALIYFIERNKGKNIRSLSKLKKVMKKLRLNKYYKYIYSIYYSITGRKIIEIPMNKYPKFINQFINLERVFAKNGIRKNLYSYNVILFFLMKLNGCHDYKHLILPLNKNKLKKKLKELFNLCGYSVN